MNTINKTILYSFIIGSLLMLAATFIATVPILQVENEISVIDKFEAKINNKIFRNLLFYQDYKQTEIKNRINHLERNGFITQNIQQSERLALESRIINSECFLIEMWSKLFTLDQIVIENKEHIQQADAIVKNKDSFEVTIQRLQDLLEESKKAAGNRLAAIQSKLNEEKNKRFELEDKKNLYRIVFIWTQIIGLILLGFSGVLEKITGKKNK